MDPKYYQSQNINVYPSSNSTDVGKLMLEENMTELTTKLTMRNFCYTEDDYKLTLLSNNQIEISPGNANIVGYGVHTSTEKIILDKPGSDVKTGKVYICLKLAYDSSEHILGDVGVEGGIKYFNGVYALWLNESGITDDTLVLGDADWDGTNISNLKENVDKTMIFDINKILVYPGITLQEFLNSISRKYIHRDGDKAKEIDIVTGKDVYNGTGGDVYGSLLFKTDRSDLGENDYGIKIGVENKNESIIELKPFNEYTREFKTLIGSNSIKSYIDLGNAEIGYVNASKMLTIGGSDILLENPTTIDDILTVRTSENRYSFQPKNMTSQNSFGKIIEGHQTVNKVNSSYLQFEDATNKKYFANLLYDYSTHILNIGGSNSAVSFNIDTYFSDILIKDGHQIKFQPNNSYIKKDEFKFNNGNSNYLQYLSGNLELSSDSSKSIKVIDKTNNSYSELFNSGLLTLQCKNDRNYASGIKFQGDNSQKSVLLSNQYNTDILKLTGSFVVDGDVSTINGGKVYNAVYNDYAELYPKHDINEELNPGDIICVDDISGKYRKVRKISDIKLVVGVYSDSYGFLLGGDKGKTEKENLKKYIPIGLSGRVYVNVESDDILPGDLLKSNANGKAVKAYPSCGDFGCIIGKALSESKNGKVLIQTMLM